MLSRRVTCNSDGQDSSYFIGWQEYEKNPFDPLHNPSGIIQMGLAENQLSLDHLEWWIAQNHESNWFNKRGESVFWKLALYQDYYGLPEFKKELADYMSDIRGRKMKFDSKKIVLTAGSTSANETLMFCLTERGDAILIPTPYYPGFDRDLKWRTEAEIVPIHCSSASKFRITKSALEEAYVAAESRNLKVKGVFLTNPSNPLGTCLSQEELDMVITFAAEKIIHIISDEIYSGTVFNASPPFISITEALATRFPDRSDPIWSRAHIVTSLSKDLGLPGFRIGAIYSDNETLIASATKMSSFGLISSQTQYLMARILGDKGFMRRYTNENLKALGKRRETLVSDLEKSGIRCLESNAGLFCWVDMRHLLSSNTFDGEAELWKKLLSEFRLNVSPGSAFHCSEPGWFRVCFANMTEQTLHVAVDRIRNMVHGMSDGTSVSNSLSN